MHGVSPICYRRSDVVPAGPCLGAPPIWLAEARRELAMRLSSARRVERSVFRLRRLDLFGNPGLRHAWLESAVAPRRRHGTRCVISSGSARRLRLFGGTRNAPSTKQEYFWEDAEARRTRRY